MSLRVLTTGCACALALAALSACSDDAPRRVAPGSTQATSSAAPDCAQGARCFDFTDDSEGWGEISDDDHYAGHDKFRDGTYRMGARRPGSWVMAAPLRLSDLSADDSVQVDVDATLGQGFPETGAWGATCWTRDLGNGDLAGFGAQVQPGALTVGVYDDGTGDFVPLRKAADDGLSTAGKRSHLTLRCRQEVAQGGTSARIEAEVGGTTVRVDYDHGVDHLGWSTGDGVGLLVAGQGADVFYDQVVVAPQ